MPDSKNHEKEPPIPHLIRQHETPRKDTTKQHKQYKPVDQPIKLKGKAK